QCTLSIGGCLEHGDRELRGGLVSAHVHGGRQGYVGGHLRLGEGAVRGDDVGRLGGPGDSSVGGQGEVEFDAVEVLVVGGLQVQRCGGLCGRRGGIRLGDGGELFLREGAVVHVEGRDPALVETVGTVGALADVVHGVRGQVIEVGGRVGVLGPQLTVHVQPQGGGLPIRVGGDGGRDGLPGPLLQILLGLRGLLGGVVARRDAHPWIHRLDEELAGGFVTGSSEVPEELCSAQVLRRRLDDDRGGLLLGEHPIGQFHVVLSVEVHVSAVPGGVSHHGAVQSVSGTVGQDGAALGGEVIAGHQALGGHLGRLGGGRGGRSGHDQPGQRGRCEDGGAAAGAPDEQCRHRESFL